MDREKKKKMECSWFMRLSENARCVIVMTNLAFAPDGRKRVGTINRVIVMEFRKVIASTLL